MDYTALIRELINKLEEISGIANSDEQVSQDDARDDDEQPKMMPPQTQKLELLKKAVGVESEYDDDCEEDEDELTILKRNAGINPAVIDSLSDDLLD